MVHLVCACDIVSFMCIRKVTCSGIFRYLQYSKCFRGVANVFIKNKSNSEEITEMLERRAKISIFRILSWIIYYILRWFQVRLRKNYTKFWSYQLLLFIIIAQKNTIRYVFLWMEISSLNIRSTFHPPPYTKRLKGNIGASPLSLLAKGKNNLCLICILDKRQPKSFTGY